MPLHARILFGLLVGAAAGIAANKLAPGTPALAFVLRYAADPIGKIFLSLLILIVVPLVFSSLVLGVAQIGDLRRLGRMGIRAGAYFLLVTTIAVGIGVTLVNVVRPGEALPASTRQQLLAEYGQQAAELKDSAARTEFGIRTVVDIVPRNLLHVLARPNPDMLALIFVALLVGVALTLIARERAGPVIALLEGVNEVAVKIIELAMRIAPLGVAALIFGVTSRFGFELLIALGAYVATVLAGLALHLTLVYSALVRLFARHSPLRFFRQVQTIMLTAFSTSSSSATLPTTIRVAQEELGIPAPICGFVLPLGATMNMNGTALFEGVTVLFLAQVFGIALAPAAQAVVVVMSVLTAVGAAGVPSGSLPLLIIVLQMLRVPAEGIAIVLGVDRLLDMCRTVLNVTGDVTCAAYVARSEGVALKP